MHKWVIELESAFPASLVGRKAAALGQLIEAGFPIPKSLCITTEALHTITARSSGVLSLTDGLLEEIFEKLPEDMPLAVRSSAVQEGLPEASLAGLFRASLNVTGAARLEGAVLDCWRSYLTSTSQGGQGGMAILLQPLIEAECAGVCFTVDPVRLQPENLLVVSGWGLGAGVVGGSVPTDTALLRRFDLRVEKLTVANKHIAMRPASESGITPTPLPPELSNIPCLPDDWLHRIGEYGLAIEQVFGAPQDIEWAIANGQVWIHQSRPITALPVEVREAVRYPIHW